MIEQPINRAPHYHGISYPLPDWDWLHSLWGKVMCKRGYHLFDEGLSSGSDGWDHYLLCDSCGLVIEIAKVVQDKAVRSKR